MEVILFFFISLILIYLFTLTEIKKIKQTQQIQRINQLNINNIQSRKTKFSFHFLILLPTLVLFIKYIHKKRDF